MWSGLLLPLNQRLWALNVYLVIWPEEQMPPNEVISASCACKCVRMYFRVCVHEDQWKITHTLVHLLLWFALYTLTYFTFVSLKSELDSLFFKLFLYKPSVTVSPKFTQRFTWFSIYIHIYCFFGFFGSCINHLLPGELIKNN